MRAHSPCCTLYGLGHVSTITNSVTVLRSPPVIPLPPHPSPKPGQPRYLLFVFTRKSHNWDHTKYSLFRLTGLLEQLVLHSLLAPSSWKVSTHCSEKAMAPHSSTLAWKIPWTEEPGRPQSMGSLRVGHDWATSLSLFTFMHWRRKWPTHYSVLAWRIPGTGEPSGLPPMGSNRVGHDWSDLAAAAHTAGKHSDWRNTIPWTSCTTQSISRLYSLGLKHKHKLSLLSNS